MADKVAWILWILPICIGSAFAEGTITSEYKDFWLVRLFINLLGYATIFVPGYLIIKYLKKKNFQTTAGNGCLNQIALNCVVGKEIQNVEDTSSAKDEDVEESGYRRGFKLVFCAVGLQISYLTWGVLQERIMTFEYGKGLIDEPGEFFKNSQFLVFINRILAFSIGCIVLLLRRQPRHVAPVYKYSFSSFSNIMSSWCQYEALKFVSFPVQVLAKACKIIPVMLMGKVVSKRTYEFYEYLTAVMISLGVTLFLLTSGDATRHRGSVTTVSGLFLLVGYMAFDSFTSNWQGELFRRYKMSSIQMMTGVNMFSCLLTAVSLLEQGGFLDSMEFMTRHPSFVIHAVTLSLCSALGQLFIFYTISSFGPVTFTIIMTIRQGLAILISCFLFSHPVTFVGFLGILFVFAALFLRIYAGQKKKKKTIVKKSAQQSNV